MSITLASQEEILHALESAHKGLSAQARAFPFRRDLMDKQSWYNAWSHISTGYCFLEQALKMVIHVHDASFDLRTMKDTCGHSFKKIYKSLQDRVPAALPRLETGYRAYQSLHNYVKEETLGDFLKVVHNDYEPWRYSLIEKRTGKDDDIAATSVHLILEIGRLAVATIKAKVVRDEESLTVGDLLGNEIRSLWREIGGYYRSRDETEGALWKRLDIKIFPRETEHYHLNGYIRFLRELRDNGELLPNIIPIENKMNIHMLYIRMLRKFRSEIERKMERGSSNLAQLHDKIHMEERGFFWDSVNKVFTAR